MARIVKRSGARCRAASRKVAAEARNGSENGYDLEAIRGRLESSMPDLVEAHVLSRLSKNGFMQDGRLKVEEIGESLDVLLPAIGKGFGMFAIYSPTFRLLLNLAHTRRLFGAAEFRRSFGYSRNPASHLEVEEDLEDMRRENRLGRVLREFGPLGYLVPVRRGARGKPSFAKGERAENFFYEVEAERNGDTVAATLRRMGFSEGLGLSDTRDTYTPARRRYYYGRKTIRAKGGVPRRSVTNKSV